MNDINWNPWGEEPPDGKPKKEQPDNMPRDPHKKGCIPMVAVGMGHMLALYSKIR